MRLDPAACFHGSTLGWSGIDDNPMVVNKALTTTRAYTLTRAEAAEFEAADEDRQTAPDAGEAMMIRRSAGAVAVLLCLLVVTPSWGRARPAAEPQAGGAVETAAATQRLQREIERLAGSGGGTVGVCALHLESGRRIALRERDRFPMASTYKVAIAVQLLTRVDRGELALDQMVELKPSDIHPGGTLANLLRHPGVSLSVRNLLELMMLVSDNSATDVLLRLAGGPEKVTARVRELGIREMEVSRPTIRLIADQTGFVLPPEAQWQPELLDSLEAAVPPDSVAAAGRRFEVDPRDTATPAAMVTLLERIYDGEGLTAGSRALLLDVMDRCQTGAARLKGVLPAGTAVAHKTGTIGGTANDAGIITLPDDAGHVAIAVFVKGSSQNVADRERAIAHIARAVYDYFLFQPAAAAP